MIALIYIIVFNCKYLFADVCNDNEEVLYIPGAPGLNPPWYFIVSSMTPFKEMQSAYFLAPAGFAFGLLLKTLFS